VRALERDADDENLVDAFFLHCCAHNDKVLEK
jgi:hypothetical protein